MTRKLFSLLLSAFALLLLMGAGIENNSAAVLVTEEESVPASDYRVTLETEEPTQGKTEDTQPVPAAVGASPIEPARTENLDETITVNGAPVPAEVGKVQYHDVTYVALGPMAQALDENAQVAWDAGSNTVTVTTANLNLTASVGQFYLQANGRYLYLEDGVQMMQGRAAVPLAALVKAFDASLTWDGATGSIAIQRGSGAIAPGEQYYNQNDLFWLSRLITAESGNQPLKGKMAVGNVVLNRVKSPIFPNSVEGVLAQKNQFTTYQSGQLANRTPYDSCVIAAKLVLDGGVVAETNGALYFDSATGSWASRNKDCIAVIGGHKFYR